MIPKGLKVGDTFEDFGLTYRVTKVIGKNYESERVGVAPLPFSLPETVVTEEDVDYESMQYAQLKKLCAERGLDATGKKADLIARLEG